jgi:CHASE3 domain sensor protein
MEENVDTFARQEIGRLWVELRSLEVDYWGPDKTNGERSEVRQHNERLDKLEFDFQHYVDARREETCLGIKALAQHIEEESAQNEEETAVKVAGIQAGATKGAASWTGIATIVGQILTLVGILFVALRR